MAQSSLFLLHWQNSTHSCRKRVTEHYKESKADFKCDWNGLFNVLWLLHHRSDDRVEREAHHGDEGKWDDAGDPLNTASVEELQSVQHNDVDFLAAVLAPFIGEVVLHSSLLVLRRHIEFRLLRSFVLILLFPDI